MTQSDTIMPVWAKIKKNVLFTGANAANYRLAFPLFKLFKQRFPRLPSEKTEICIEGFPRSGNSWFVSVFQYWNKGVSVAHHSHLAGSLKYAIDRGCPAVVLIRKPEDAVASALAWDGLLDVNVALMSYLSFYNSLWKERNRLVVLKFEDVVSHPDRCIASINSRCSKAFNFTGFTSEVDEAIRQQLKKVNRQNQRNDSNTSLPNAAREAAKQSYIELAKGSRFYPACLKLYSEYVEFVGLPTEAGQSGN